MKNLIICGFRRIHVKQVPAERWSGLSGFYRLLSSQATMADVQNIPHGRSQQGSQNPCNPKNPCEKKFVSICVICGQKIHAKLQLLKFMDKIIPIMIICFLRSTAEGDSLNSYMNFGLNS